MIRYRTVSVIMMSWMALMNKQILQTRWNTWRWILIFFNVFLSWPGSSKTFHRPCALCHSDSNDGICDDCYHRYFSAQCPRCSRCANALPFHDHEREFAVWWLCEKTPVVRWNDCRYRLWTTIGPTRPFAEIPCQLDHGTHYGKADSQGNREKQASGLPDFLIAVPLGKRRLIERGFNQSLEIAKTLSRSLKADLVFGSGWKNPGNGKTIDYFV